MNVADWLGLIAGFLLGLQVMDLATAAHKRWRERRAAQKSKRATRVSSWRCTACEKRFHYKNGKLVGDWCGRQERGVACPLEPTDG